MKLHLKDKTEVDIFRQTCAHYQPDTYGRSTCSWNINPVEIVNDERSGYFAIGPWGCDGHRDDCGHWVETIEKFEQLIPIKSVVRISKVGEWEKKD